MRSGLLVCSGFLLGIDAFDDDPVVKRTKLHGVLLHCQTSLFFR
jgi:hypothetical protein